MGEPLLGALPFYPDFGCLDGMLPCWVREELLYLVCWFKCPSLSHPELFRCTQWSRLTSHLGSPWSSWQEELPSLWSREEAEYLLPGQWRLVRTTAWAVQRLFPVPVPPLAHSITLSAAYGTTELRISLLHTPFSPPQAGQNTVP